MSVFFVVYKTIIKTIILRAVSIDITETIIAITPTAFRLSRICIIAKIIEYIESKTGIITPATMDNSLDKKDPAPARPKSPKALTPNININPTETINDINDKIKERLPYLLQCSLF